MADDAAIETKFWKALKSDMTVMLGLDGARDGHTQPMTAMTEQDEGGPIYFFATKDNTLVAALTQSHRALCSFVSKGHDLFATVHGDVEVETSEATIDRLWNPHVAAWYEGGRNDPKLAVLRLDTERAQIWLNGSSIGAAIKRALGRDPKEDYKDKVAEVAL